MPQGRVKFIISTAPKRPVPRRRLLLITGATESPTERLQRIERIIRERCAGYLSADDLALLLKPFIPKPAALPPPKPSPTVKAKKATQRGALAG
jgi:hypothetical protein